MISSSSEILLQLLRAALGNEGAGGSARLEGLDFGSVSGEVWKEVIDLSFEQGVAAIAVDGLGCAHDNDTLRYDNDNQEGLEFSLDSAELEELKYEWFGEVFAREEEYHSYHQAIINLCRFYQSHGIKMMLLKGYGLSLNYPIPSHRPVGDIDVFVFEDKNRLEVRGERLEGGFAHDTLRYDDDGSLRQAQGELTLTTSLPAWKRGDEAIEEQLGIKVDKSHEHHTVFQFEGFTVENHYDIVNTKEKKSSAALDATLKRLAEGARRTDEGFYLPSADFNAIFVIRHLGQHIAGEKVTLRHLLDWGLFIDKHSEAVDWDFVTAYWKEIGILEFARCINRICVDSLGFDAQRFHGELSDNAALSARLLNDILHPEFEGECPQGSFLKEALFKTRRYIANGWKRKLVYKEGLVESFIMSSIAKLKRRNLMDKSE